MSKEITDRAQWVAVRRIGFFVLLAILAGGYFLQRSIDSKTRSTSTAQRPPEIYKTTAPDLFDRYDKNEVETDMALKAKMIEVSGAVDSITKDAPGYLRVDLLTGNRPAHRTAP